MADKHTAIQTQVITDWSVQKRGRLFICQQGKFRYLHTDGVITISPYPKKQSGFPDLFGWEFDDRYIIPVPVFCMVEVKTVKYSKLSPEQLDHLNYCVQIGGRAYVARETDSGYELVEWGVK